MICFTFIGPAARTWRTASRMVRSGPVLAGWIAGAGLDVYENEPFIHPGLKRGNVVLAPHLASASLETRTKMACIAAENITALFKGQRPPNMLNADVLKTR